MENATLGFTNAHVRGSYALTGFAGANVGGVVGICHFDGNGHYTGTYTGNFAGEDGKRLVMLNRSNQGEYAIKPDGTGTIHEVEVQDGVTSEFDDDIVILHAEVIAGQMVATEIFGLTRQADAAGLLLTLHLKRLPDMDGALA